MTPEDIVAALDRTFADGCARVEYSLDPHLPPLKRRRGGLLRPLLNAGATVAKRGYNAVAPFPLRGHGVVDLAGRRCLVAHRRYGEVIIDDRYWCGAAGEEVAALAEDSFPGWNPLLVCELLRGAVDVAPGDEPTVYCDLLAAADATGGDLTIPSGVDRVSTLRRVPLHVQLAADGHIDSVRHASHFGDFTVEVVELGVAQPDWTRIPGET
jgi:hypothetical protein